jgi:hypothetical protein
LCFLRDEWFCWVVSVFYLEFVVDRLLLESSIYLGCSSWISMFVQLFGIYYELLLEWSRL